jgi:hypothetical protein
MPLESKSRTTSRRPPRPAQILELEGLDRLGLVVLDDREVLSLQAAHERARLVANDDRHADEGHGGLERR